MTAEMHAARRWRLEWDGPPPPNMNGSDSPWRRRAARRLWRANAIAMAIACGLPTREIVRYRVTGVFFRRALLVADQDGDVSRLKAALDGLVEGNYLPGDTRRYVEWGDVSEARGRPGFSLIIEELPHDDATARLAQRHYARNDGVDPLEALRRLQRRSRAAPPTPRRQASPGGAAGRLARRGLRIPGLDPGD